jgi:hypothetical protein
LEFIDFRRSLLFQGWELRRLLREQSAWRQQNRRDTTHYTKFRHPTLQSAIVGK